MLKSNINECMISVSNRKRSLKKCRCVADFVTVEGILRKVSKLFNFLIKISSYRHYLVVSRTSLLGKCSLKAPYFPRFSALIQLATRHCKFSVVGDSEIPLTVSINDGVFIFTTEPRFWLVIASTNLSAVAFCTKATCHPFTPCQTSPLEASSDSPNADFISFFCSDGVFSGG